MRAHHSATASTRARTSPGNSPPAARSEDGKASSFTTSTMRGMLARSRAAGWSTDSREANADDAIAPSASPLLPCGSWPAHAAGKAPGRVDQLAARLPYSSLGCSARSDNRRAHHQAQPDRPRLATSTNSLTDRSLVNSLRARMSARRSRAWPADRDKSVIPRLLLIELEGHLLGFLGGDFTSSVSSSARSARRATADRIIESMRAACRGVRAAPAECAGCGCRTN